jgi:hypothetical protein
LNVLDVHHVAGGGGVGEACFLKLAYRFFDEFA